MTDAQWVFKEQQPGDTTRDPISGEFFATEAIRNSAEALIREGIQNSLDAAPPGQTVRVRLHLSGVAGAAEAQDIAEFIGGIGVHLSSPGNGIREEHRPDLVGPCRYLAFEDFGTTGLEGDVEQWHRKEGVKNKFYAFFRAEGESDKDGANRRGRWGVGKFVFPRASSGSTFFGLTVRKSDGREVLLGRAILKAHAANGARYVPDGYFGTTRDIPGLVAPVEDEGMLARFRIVFGLSRQREPGLSLVIPWYDQEITMDRLLEATVRDWFYSILQGELEVELSGPDASRRLDRSTLDTALSLLLDEPRRDLEPLLALARFAVSEKGRAPVVLGPANVQGAPRWDAGMLSEADAAKLRESLDAAEPVAVRIPLPVRPRGPGLLPSYFDVFLGRDEAADSGRPVFVREGIIVTDAKGGRARGFRSLVTIDDPPLAELLGDAENPSHTEWRSDTANFKDRYQYGPGYLTFVKQSVAELVSRLRETEDDRAPRLLLDLFSLPKPEGATKKKAGPAPEPPPPTLPRTVLPYQILRHGDGFTVSKAPKAEETPSELEVYVAYDVRKGDPIHKYDPSDFQLLVKPVVISEAPKGLAKIDSSGNMIRLKVTDPDFSLTMAGFDTRRDLVVRVVAKGRFNDDAAA